MIVYESSNSRADDGTTIPPDYQELYEKEIVRNRELHDELEFTRSQSQTFSRELSRVFVHSKRKRRELADANTQLVRFASDLRKTITDLRHAHN